MLLGSDFPTIPYSYGTSSRRWSGCATAALDDDWLRAVCWRNGEALFGATTALTD